MILNFTRIRLCFDNIENIDINTDVDKKVIRCTILGELLNQRKNDHWFQSHTHWAMDN